MSEPQCTVSLTYNGATLNQAEVVVPALDRYGFKGTFYADPIPFLENLGAWQSAHEQGHEISVGSLLSSCLPDGSLPCWTPEMILDDLCECEELLEEFLPLPSGRSLGLPIGASTCAGGENYLSHLTHFRAIRTGVSGMNLWSEVDFRSLMCLPMNDLSGEQLIDAVRMGMKHPSYLVLSFDAVGEGESGVDASDHAELLQFLDQSRDLVRVLPVMECYYLHRKVRMDSLQLS
ncbi:MAG: hypothetical protein KDC26_02670 [Armatimonadetes bacterium]|nr:hypothetical protein [Armatimonadota bacterium]